MFLVSKEILLRLAGNWELLCGAQKRGDGMIGEKKAMEGDGALFWGPRVFEEYGLNPEQQAEGRAAFPTSDAAPVCQQHGDLHVSRNHKQGRCPRKQCSC